MAGQYKLPRELRPLLQGTFSADAEATDVVWARVRGYPSWPVRA